MVGAGESYLPAFALAIGMGEVQVGLFSTVPLLSGAVIQLLTPWALSKAGSVKRWVAFSALVQSCAFLSFFYLALNPPEHNFLVVFMIAAVYWGAGFAAAPPWNFWMTHLVPIKDVTTYFPKRFRYAQLGIFLGLLGGGYALQYNIKIGPLTSVFSILFLFAFVSRASSTVLLTMKAHEKEWVHHSKLSDLWHQIQRFAIHPGYRRFFGFLFIFNTVIFISSPFLTSYLLAQLKLSYDHYMAILACLLVSKIIAMGLMTKLVQRFGLKKVFLVGALGLSPLPGLWMASTDFYFMMFLQMLSGFFWAFYEVGLSVTFFNELERQDKIPVLTVYNVFSCAAMLLGTLLGGKLLLLLGENLQGYWFLFATGAALRTFVIVYFWLRSRKYEDLIQAKNMHWEQYVNLKLQKVFKH